jgi:hypothetical protein
MHFSSTIASSKRNKVMTPEQFNQVVVAITEGRYSWACVLILRFAGYNPVHFIPYRTYSRLVKENASHHVQQSSVNNTIERSQNHQVSMIASVSSSRSLVKVNDLSHLEAIEATENKLQGSYFPSWLTSLIEEPRSVDLAEQGLQKIPSQSHWNWC